MMIFAEEVRLVAKKTGRRFLSIPLSTQLDDPLAMPDFLWDEPTTVA